METLEKKVMHKFSRSVQDKGADYCYEYDSVSELHIDGRRITGYVNGRRTYDIELSYSRSQWWRFFDYGIRLRVRTLRQGQYLQTHLAFRLQF